MRRLEQAGIILGYRAEVDFEALGIRHEGWILLRLQQNNHQTLERLRAALDDARCVLDAYEVAGPFDVLVHVVARDGGEWSTFAHELEQMGVLLSARMALIQSTIKLRAPVAVP